MADAFRHSDPLMMTVSQIAERDGVSKPTVSAHVKRLSENFGLTVERDGRGRVVGVAIAEYDRLRAKFDDAVRAQAPAAVEAPGAAGDPVLREEQARLARYKADLAELELRERLGELIPVDGVAAMAHDLARLIVGRLERLPACAEEFAEALTRGGTPALRVAIRQAVGLTRNDIADALVTCSEIAKRDLEDLRNASPEN